MAPELEYVVDAPPPVVADLLKINQHLYIRCTLCDPPREQRLSAVEAVQLLGPQRPFTEVRRRLRCSACGNHARDGHLSIWPCSLDASAASARWKAARAAEAGEPYDLEQTLTTLRKLLGGRGDLGGDGPVQMPVEGASNGD